MRLSQSSKTKDKSMFRSADKSREGLFSRFENMRRRGQIFMGGRKDLGCQPTGFMWAQRWLYVWMSQMGLPDGVNILTHQPCILLFTELL